ncbi:hypothetical protein [Rubidibacter lacunae]|uniref:hypothetical protein n=1 Tax=Rubidibacter lacunae TaxID=582514 RepID=UPI0018DB6862|nr:hypothetical protein [Rubidibacter lacunae]
MKVRANDSAAAKVGVHGAEVVCMFFLDDNCFVLRKGDPIGERLAKLAERQDIFLMMCDLFALERNVSGQPLAAVCIGFSLKTAALMLMV